MPAFYAYLLRCADGSYYVGHTDDLARRFAEHQSGAVRGYAASRLPVELAWWQEFQTREDAKAAEMQVKAWSRAKKEALQRGEWDRLRRFAKKQSWDAYRSRRVR